MKNWWTYRQKVGLTDKKSCGNEHYQVHDMIVTPRTEIVTWLACFK